MISRFLYIASFVTLFTMTIWLKTSCLAVSLALTKFKQGIINRQKLIQKVRLEVRNDILMFAICIPIFIDLFSKAGNRNYVMGSYIFNYNLVKGAEVLYGMLICIAIFGISVIAIAGGLRMEDKYEKLVRR